MAADRSQFDAGWDPARSHVRVMLRDIELEVRLGLHPHEKAGDRRQRIVVSVDLLANTERLETHSFAGVIDYERLHGALAAWSERPHTELIESYLEELIALCFEDQRVTACRVSILKPDVFPGRAVAGVEAFRLRG